MRNGGWILGAGLLAGALWLGGRVPTTSDARAPTASRPPLAPSGATTGAGDAETALPPLPASLRDTEVDGALRVDAAGRFDPGPEALALFSYFLSASGEEPDATIRARIVAHIHRTLAPPASGEAEALLDTVLRYREHMRVLTTEGTPPAALDRRLQWIREERRRIFGAEVAEKLFAEEEQVTALDLERRSVVEDTMLPAEEKQRRLEALDARLPERVRTTRQRVMEPTRSNAEVEALRARGGDEAAVMALRERSFGTDAALRLARLDEEQAAWTARLAAYRAARAEILADPSLGAEEREAGVVALRAARFDAQERIRVEALDAAPGSPNR